MFHWNNPVFEKWRNEYTMKNQFTEAPFEVGVCSGSFMICKTSVLKKIQGFDERFFLYYEDFDLSKRMKAEGKIQCVPLFAVEHIGARAAHHSSLARKYMIQSLIKFYNKWGWKI